MTKKFTKTVENFICTVCGFHVKGNGYTNHCPHCLSCLHVDVLPGDRACSCHGIMDAVGFEIRNGNEYILHRCRTCGFERKNRVSPDDNREILYALSGSLTVKKIYK